MIEKNNSKKEDANGKTKTAKVPIIKRILNVFLILFSPVFSLLIAIAVIGILLYNQLIIYAIVYSFQGYYTVRKGGGLTKTWSKVYLEKDKKKTITKALLVPRILLRLFVDPLLAIAYYSVFMIFLIPGFFISLFINFIEMSIDFTHKPNNESLIKVIYKTFLKDSTNEITGFLF